MMKIGDKVKLNADKMVIIGYSVREHCFYVRLFKNDKAIGRLTVSALLFDIPQKFYYRTPSSLTFDSPNGYSYNLKLDDKYYVYYISDKEVYKETGWLFLIDIHEVNSWKAMEEDFLIEKGVIVKHYMKDCKRLSNKQPATEWLNKEDVPVSTLDGTISSITLLAVEFKKEPYGNRFVIIDRISKINEIKLKKHMKKHKRILRGSVIVNTGKWSYTADYTSLIKIKK